MLRTARTFTLGIDTQDRLAVLIETRPSLFIDHLAPHSTLPNRSTKPAEIVILDEFGLLPADYPALHTALGSSGSVKLDYTPAGIRAAVHRCRSQAQMDAYSAALTNAKGRNKAAMLATRRAIKAAQYAELVASRSVKLNVSRAVDALLTIGMDTLEKAGKDAVTTESRGRKSRNAEQTTR